MFALPSDFPGFILLFFGVLAWLVAGIINDRVPAQDDRVKWLIAMGAALVAAFAALLVEVWLGYTTASGDNYYAILLQVIAYQGVAFGLTRKVMKA